MAVSYKQAAESVYLRLLLMLEQARTAELVFSLDGYLDIEQEPGNLAYSIAARTTILSGNDEGQVRCC